MKQQLQQVREFQKAFNVRQPGKPELLHPDRYLLRIKLINEEQDEYTMGCVKRDMENIAKELGDILYVTLGAILEHGLDKKMERVFNAIHENNMQKIAHGKVGKDGKFEKPEGWKGPDLKDIIQD